MPAVSRALRLAATSASKSHRNSKRRTWHSVIFGFKTRCCRPFVRRVHIMCQWTGFRERQLGSAARSLVIQTAAKPKRLNRLSAATHVRDSLRTAARHDWLTGGGFNFEAGLLLPTQ